MGGETVYAYLREIESELKKHFLPNEVERILAYYTKEFERRMLLKEDPMTIYRTLEIDQIKEKWLPETLKMRHHKSFGIILKSLVQLMTYMFKISSLIPYGIILSVFMLAYTGLIAGVFYVIYQAGITFYEYIIDVVYFPFEQAEYVLVLGVGVTIFSIIILLTLVMIKFFLYLTKVTIEINIDLIQVKEKAL